MGRHVCGSKGESGILASGENVRPTNNALPMRDYDDIPDVPLTEEPACERHVDVSIDADGLHIMLSTDREAKTATLTLKLHTTTMISKRVQFKDGRARVDFGEHLPHGTYDAQAVFSDDACAETTVKA